VLADWSVEEVARRADRVDVGVVVKRAARWERGELYTDVHLQVERTLKGKATTRLIVTQLGGRDRGEVLEVVGDARLPVGARVVLFTYAHADGRRYLVGMSLGAYRVLADGRLEQDVEASLARGRVLLPPPGRRATTWARIEDAARP
jgi:hypothetical protein